MGSFISHFVLDSHGMRMPSAKSTFYPYCLRFGSFFNKNHPPLFIQECANGERKAVNTTLDSYRV